MVNDDGDGDVDVDDDDDGDDDDDNDDDDDAVQFAEPLAIGFLLMTRMFLYNVKMLMFKYMFF